MRGKMKKEDIWIKVCPECHSKEVTSRGAISRDALSPNFVCLTCGFQSAVFPEIKLEDAEHLPEQPRNYVPSRMPIFADQHRREGPVTRFIYGITALAMLLLILIAILEIISWTFT
jgi:hypothetical protein